MREKACIGRVIRLGGRQIAEVVRTSSLVIEATATDRGLGAHTTMAEGDWKHYRPGHILPTADASRPSPQNGRG